MKLADSRAILAIDPTSRGLAFAFFENGELLDWGTRNVPGDDIAALDRILGLCPAEVLVIEDRDAAGCRRRPRVKHVLEALEKHALGHGIEVRTVARDETLRAWQQRGKSSKDLIAAALSELFPVLQMILPRQRGKYRPECARMRIFDAASLAVRSFGLRDREAA